MDAPKVGVAAIITRGDKVLLLRRKAAHGQGTWSMPGGHLEPGETPEECAARETREEVGLEVAGLRFWAVTNDIFTAAGKHYITLWMQTETASGEPVVAAPDEVFEVAWFAWDALPTPLFLPFENLLAGKCYPQKTTP